MLARALAGGRGAWVTRRGEARRRPGGHDGVMADRIAEVERKYEVADGTVLPSLTEAADGLSMGQPTEVVLDAVYFDTADLALARRGVTLRRRSGGDDAGWHVKLPVSDDERTEIRWPSGRTTRVVPKAVLASVRAWVRDGVPVPVASVSTRRLERVLTDGTGVLLATLCDDEVRAVRLVGERLEQTWREWEVELVGGDEDLLDAVGERLLDAGAEPSRTSSKLRRTLGDLAPEGDRGGDAPTTGATLEEALVAALHDHISRLHEHDAGLRAGEEDAVHRMRIAARRSRSALRTFKPLLDRERADHLAEELRWLGQELAAARDAQVLRERLLATVAEQPTELVMGRVAGRVRADLRATERAGRARAVATLDGERDFRLLDDLDSFAAAPPFTAGQEDPAASELPRLLHRDAKRLRRAVAVVGAADEPVERDAALHEARKKAKRLRYAAELAAPVLGKRARRLGRRAKRVQQALGRHQDAVVARAYLREQGVRAHLDGENAFTYGRLHALQDGTAAAAVDDFERAWKKMPPKDLRRWLVD